MLARVAQYIRKHGMLPDGSRALVGVSGGMDSAALLHILCALREKMGFGLEAAHFNHGIRAESAEEERFVGEMCARLGVPLNTGRADVPALARESGVSLEVAAREARHAFFRKVMAERGISRLALAHHRDDQAETVLLRLVRGSGAAGLGAMAPVEASGIIRPLLCAGREDIRRYCEENGVEWREDASNADNSIPRNRIRNAVMPLLAEINPHAPETLCRAAELLREDDDYLSAEAAKAVEGTKSPDGVAVPAASLAALHPALLGRAIRQLLKQAGMTKDVERVNVADICSLLADGNTGRRIDLDGGFAALREARDLVIVPRLPEPVAYGPVALNIPGETRAAGGVFISEILEAIPADYQRHPKGVQYFDIDALPAGIAARGRQPGDRFHPLNAPGGRKLKEYLIDQKSARWGRDSLPLLASGREILWAVGFTIADSVKITERTRRVLKVTYRAGEGNE